MPQLRKEFCCLSHDITGSMCVWIWILALFKGCWLPQDKTATLSQVSCDGRVFRHSKALVAVLCRGSNNAPLLQLLHKHQLLFGAEIQTHPCSQPPSDREAAHLQKCKSAHLNSHLISEVFRRLVNFLTVDCIFWRAVHDNEHSGPCVLLLCY